MEKQRNRKDEKNYRKSAKRKPTSQARGITLVALVITIIIIIILATVTIRFAFEDDGIIQRAETAGGSGADEPEIPTMPISDAKQQTSGMTEKTIVIDAEDNKITVPKGFKIAADSGDTVQQGIVIEDVSASTDTAVQGSQYVWIPVGTFYKDGGALSNEIKLGRYTFDESGNTIAPLQYAEDYAGEPVGIKDYSGDDCTESTTYDAGNESDGLDGRNATAKNLAEFINSTKPIDEGGNGGYYIGRYEASYASGATSTSEVGDYANCKAASKVSTSFRTSSDGSMLYDPGTLWNYITQPAASKVAINTYAGSDSVKSDLMNSYAWDTAIVYIQEAGNDNYANATSKNDALSDTGKLDPDEPTLKDEACKINDMASNVYEWTTEHSSDAGSSIAGPCVVRGGLCNIIIYYTANRNSYNATYSSGNIGFRLMLYV